MSSTETPPDAKAKAPTQREILLEINARLAKLDIIEERVNGLYVVEAQAFATQLDAKVEELKELTDGLRTGTRVVIDEDSVRELAGAFRVDLIQAITDGDFIAKIAAGTRDKIAATTAQKVVEEVKNKVGESKATKAAIWTAAIGVIAIIGAGAYAVAGYEPPVVEGVAVTPENA